MSELEHKVQKSIERLKAFEPEEGYHLAFSGGKDSVVCKALLDMSGCKYNAVYRVTSVDPPELVKFIKKEHPDVVREIPRFSDNYKNPKLAGKPVTMWNLIPEKKIPPSRKIRYCCEYLKESAGDNKMVVTGVRWAESPNRKNNQGAVTIMGKKIVKEIGDNQNFKVGEKGRGAILTNDNIESRRMIEQCYKRHKTTVNPIIEWTDDDVWEFIKGNGVRYCSLYDEGFTRIGCIACPLAMKKDREKELFRWPFAKRAYIHAFEKMLENRKNNGMGNILWPTVEHAMKWFLESDILPGQYSFFEEEEE